MRPPSLRFFCSFSLAALFVLFGGALSFVVIHYICQGTNVEAAKEINNVTFSGNEFLSRIGATEIAGEKHIIRSLSGDDQIVLSRPVNFKAEHFPYVRYEIHGKIPSVFIYLLWRTEQQPENIFRQELNWGPSSRGVTRLSSNKNWQGEITEIGFDLYGDLREEPVILSKLTLSGSNLSNSMTSTWSDWLSFHGWSQSSINNLSAAQSENTPSPILFAAFSCSVALLSAFFWSRFVFPLWPGVYLFVAALFWLLNDFLWQLQLSTQVNETNLTYADRSMSNVIAVGSDIQLYTYATRLTRSFLPSEPSTIFILHKDTGHVFDRLRLQFHLLPHNIFNHGAFLPSAGGRINDYVLILGDIPHVRFDVVSGKVGQLSDGGTTLSAEIIYDEPIATLYKITVR